MTTRAEELKAIVDDAWAATETLEGSPQTRADAFKLVLEAALTNGSAATPPTDEDAQNAPSGCDTPGERTAALAAVFAVKPEQLGNLFDVRRAEPALTQFAVRQLPDDCASATREITLLVTVARNALGLATGTWLLRDLAGTYERLDLRRFQSTLDAMEEIFVRGEPGDEDRGITLRSLGIEAAQTIAQRILA